MPSWRPPNAYDPDELDAWRFRLLAEVNAECAERLVAHFAPLWLNAAHLPLSRRSEVPDTVELKVADSWDPPDGTQVLRMTSWYTGETRWLHAWDGACESALAWVEGAAEDFGGWVLDEREHYGTRTPWDE